MPIFKRNFDWHNYVRKTPKRDNFITKQNLSIPANLAPSSDNYRIRFSIIMIIDTEVFLWIQPMMLNSKLQLAFWSNS